MVDYENISELLKKYGKDPLEIDFELVNITDAQVERAREVARLFYSSRIWRKSAQLGEPVSLIGYINVITRVINRFPGEILNDFKVAHHLKYITIYQGQNQKLCIKQGEMKDEFLVSQ